MRDAFVTFLVVAVALVWFASRACSAPPASKTSTPTATAAATSTPAGGDTGEFVCDDEKKAASLKMFSNLGIGRDGLGDEWVRVEPTTRGAIYRFTPEGWNTIKPEVGELIKGISNADACIHDRARSLDFYDPFNKLIGRASPLTGVTVF